MIRIGYFYCWSLVGLLPSGEMAVLQKYSWIFALTTVAFCFSSFENGANDVANSYAALVAARTLKMWQAGILAAITEFVGAVALGSSVTSTIKNGIVSIDRFKNQPGVLMLAMGTAEVGSGSWLMIATGLGFPVSTTKTVVRGRQYIIHHNYIIDRLEALIGVGFASKASIQWG